MKKIKSAKVKNADLVKTSSGMWIYSNCNYPVFSEKNFEDNPDKFEIEYEEEKQYVDLRVVCSKGFSTNEIRRFIETQLRLNYNLLGVEVTETERGVL